LTAPNVVKQTGIRAFVSSIRARIFGYTNTIEGILSGWTKTIRDLEAHSVEHTKQAIVKTEEAGRLLAQRVKHAEEAAKASDLVGKFKALIG
jgi:hypothetical protein